MKIKMLSNAQMQTYLQDIGMSIAGVSDVHSAGDGNMNCTLRVSHSQGSVIVKQASAYCEKYPHIPAPIERANQEVRFYNIVHNHQTTTHIFPRLLANDDTNNLLILEDLKSAASYSSVYNRGLLPASDIKLLSHHLKNINSIRSSKQHTLINRNMRLLNHDHIFVLPLVVTADNNIFNVNPLLAKHAELLTTDSTYCDIVKQLGDIYLSDGDQLLHGDYYPNSWLKAEDFIYVIDAEFGFFGRPEFDLGNFIGHLLLSQQPYSHITCALEHYNPGNTFDVPLALRFAGVEIMRRLLGAAQLPLSANLNAKQDLLTLSKDLVLTANIDSLR